MKSLSFGNIQSLDFSTQDVDYLSQERKNLEYTLQQIARIVPSDDFQGVRQRIVNEDKARDEEDYVQAAANNLTAGKTTAEQTIASVRDYKVSEGSIDTALEKRVAEDMLGDKIVNNEEVYATYLNNPEAYTKDSDYISNLLLADKLYTDYQNIWKNPDNSTKFLAQVGGELATSILASWNNLGTVVEGTKQGFKINAFKDVLNMDEDILTPTALGHNLRRVLNRYAREKTPEEFSSWIEDKLKPAINSLPMIYQAEVLEWIFEGYQAIDNLWLISDLPDDIGRITKAVDNISTARRAKAVGDFSQSLDSVLVKNEEAISSTAKANVTETSVLKNTDEVKKEVVREATDKAVDNMLDTEDKVFARNLIEEDNVDDISEPVNKAVVDHKNWWEQNMTTIGRADGTPFASEGEAIRVARDIMIKKAEAEGYKVLSAMSRSDYKTPSLKAVNTGEGTQIEGTGLYYSLHKPDTILNSSLSYQVEFRNFLPSNRNNYGTDAIKKYIEDEYFVKIDKIPFKDYTQVLEDIGKDYEALRKDGWTIKNVLNTLEKRYSKSIAETEDFQKILDQDPAATVEDFVAFEVNNSIQEDVLKYITFKTMTKDFKEFKEPVNKFFLLKPQTNGKFLNKTLIGETTEDVEVLENILKIFDKYNIVKPGVGGEYTITDLANDMSKYEEGNVYNIRHAEELLAYKIKETSKVKNKPFIEYMKAARDILKNEANIRGSWHSDVNLMHYYEEDVLPFFTNKPTVKGGKVTYQRRIDNPELLKYYTEPVQINGNWYVRVFNGDDNFIKIEGN